MSGTHALHAVWPLGGTGKQTALQVLALETANGQPYDFVVGDYTHLELSVRAGAGFGEFNKVLLLLHFGDDWDNDLGSLNLLGSRDNSENGLVSEREWKTFRIALATALPGSVIRRVLVAHFDNKPLELFVDNVKLIKGTPTTKVLLTLFRCRHLLFTCCFPIRRVPCGPNQFVWTTPLQPMLH